MQELKEKDIKEYKKDKNDNNKLFEELFIIK